MVLMRRREMRERRLQPRARGQLREGWAFVRDSPLHRTVLLTNAVVGCLAFNFPQFYSSLVELSFHTNPSVFGAAETINAVTAVGGGIWLSRRMPALSTNTFALACLLLGVSLAWSAAAPTVPLFLLGMPFFGAVVVFYMTVAQSLVQGSTPPELVGRVMTLYTIGIMGTTPVGGLLAGVLIDRVSPRAAIGLGAVSLVACAAVVAIAHREPLGCEPPDERVEVSAVPT
jgi:MFS family permease